MAGDLSMTMSTASTVLALSKLAWSLGTSLSKLDQDADGVDASLSNLAEELKSLGNEYGLVYIRLEALGRYESERGSTSQINIDNKIWDCLATQVGETSRTMQEMQLFLKSVKGEGPVSIEYVRRRVEMAKDGIAGIRLKVRKQSDIVHVILLLISIALGQNAPSTAGGSSEQQLEELWDIIKSLELSLHANSSLQPSGNEVALLRYAREVVVRGSMGAASDAPDFTNTWQRTTNGSTHIASWVHPLGPVNQEQQSSALPDTNSTLPHSSSCEEVSAGQNVPTSTGPFLQRPEAPTPLAENLDDDLDVDLAKAALDTGSEAFEAHEWEDAYSLLQEALQALQQLPTHQRAFCDNFTLQYKLAVCAYHIRDPLASEQALSSLYQQSAISDEHRTYLYNASHLLTLLYIRAGQLDRARLECERTLQGRRRLLGKQSDASLESTALMAHLYLLLNNRARAKSYLAMIPQSRRDAVLKAVQDSVGATPMQYPDPSSPSPRSVSDASEMAVNRIGSDLSAFSMGMLTERRYDHLASASVPQSPSSSYGQSPQMIPVQSPSTSHGLSPSTSHRQSDRHSLSSRTGLERRQSLTVTSISLAPEERSISGAPDKEVVSLTPQHLTSSQANGEPTLSPTDLPEVGDPSHANILTRTPTQEANDPIKSNPLTRKEILTKVGCQPRDPLEDAVCSSDKSTLHTLLKKRKDSWRSKLLKGKKSERVTALHFAALFGEIDMASALIAAGFNVNEVPYGYSSNITPLTFAIGARQVEMVDFLINNGARPAEPDTWSTLASQLMNRSWLMKTVSDSDPGKQRVPSRIIAIFKILLKHGWNLNAPYDTVSGGTVLHQAVTFWTGVYRCDLDMRTIVTSFLCENGANPFQRNAEGKAPYDLAEASGHRDLLLILDRGWSGKNANGLSPKDGNGNPHGPFELPSETRWAGLGLG